MSKYTKEELSSIRELSQSIFIVKEELDRIYEIQNKLKNKMVDDTNLFLIFSDCDQLRRKLRIISKSFFNRVIDIKSFLENKNQNNK